MSRGFPDYGNPGYSVSAPITDMNALIVALRGRSSIDSLGRINFVDTFGEGLYAWDVSSLNGGATPVCQTAYAEIPPACTLMDAGVTSGSDQSIMNTAFHPGGSPRVGLDLGLRLNAYVPDIIVSLIWKIGGYANEAKVTITHSSGDVSIQTPSGAVSVGSVGLFAYNRLWVPFKLTVDYEARTYERLLIGQENFEVNDIEIDNSVDVNKGPLAISITAKSGGASYRYLYVGHVIVTEDEP